MLFLKSKTKVLIRNLFFPIVPFLNCSFTVHKLWTMHCNANYQAIIWRKHFRKDYLDNIQNLNAVSNDNAPASDYEITAIKPILCNWFNIFALCVTRILSLSKYTRVQDQRSKLMGHYLRIQNPMLIWCTQLGVCWNEFWQKLCVLAKKKKLAKLQFYWAILCLARNEGVTATAVVALRYSGW